MAENQLAPRDPPPEVFSEILKQGREQLEIRKSEIELRKQENDQNFEYAKAALAAQAEDLKDRRKHEKDLTSKRYSFVAWIVVVLLIFCGYTLYLGKERFAEDLLKLFLGFATGATSGYWYGKSRTQKQDDSSPGE